MTVEEAIKFCKELETVHKEDCDVENCLKFAICSLNIII